MNYGGNPGSGQCPAHGQAAEQRRRGQATVFAAVDYKLAGTWNVKSSRGMDRAYGSPCHSALAFDVRHGIHKRKSTVRKSIGHIIQSRINEAGETQKNTPLRICPPRKKELSLQRKRRRDERIALVRALQDYENRLSDTEKRSIQDK